jgi:hypothetical protein
LPAPGTTFAASGVTSPPGSLQARHVSLPGLTESLRRRGSRAALRIPNALSPPMPTACSAIPNERSATIFPLTPVRRRSDNAIHRVIRQRQMPRVTLQDLAINLQLSTLNFRLLDCAPTSDGRLHIPRRARCPGRGRFRGPPGLPVSPETVSVPVCAEPI